jgi:hypothetical protein
MNEITDAFIRSVNDRVETVSTVGQFREYMKMYESVLYNTAVRRIFVKRIFFLEDMHKDKVSQKILADSMSELEDAAEVNGGNFPLRQGTTFNLIFRCDEGQVLESAITEIICTTLNLAEGKKKEAARILGISTQDISALIDKNADRKLFLQNLKKKLKTIDE